MQIIQNGFGYQKDGNILFSVKKYKEYGALSGRDISKNINLTRELNAVEKENLNDFVLWKRTDIGKTWGSPWGDGRPGWHIECSAMSYKYLGADFDIHGGGPEIYRKILTLQES
jgi:cysteinyl-tRNA synthetase